MSAFVAAWWLCFWTALGLCIGSFLNVVIYRIPRNRSLRSPLWSACPFCKKRIDWFDNIPLISFVFLRGRCRHCDIPISTRYPTIEATTALVVLMLLDAFFIGQSRAGLAASPFGLTDRLASDWPILLAHIILFSCLFAMSAIDLEHYWVDIRFTNLVTICGFLLHTLWTPRHSANWTRPLDTTAVVCLFAMAGLVVTWLVFVCRAPEDDDDDRGLDSSKNASEDANASRRLPPPLTPPARVAAWVAVALLIGLAFVLFLDETRDLPLRHTGRAIVPILFLIALIFLESTVPRASDQAIIEAIYEERFDARRVAIAELSLFLPAIVLGCIGWWIMNANAEFAGRINTALHSSVGGSRGFFRDWAPWQGFATAASGYVIAGAIGWAVRIVFTLLFGKEAFGAGDIHMMAAAGCVAGWPVVLLGFMLTCVLALAGWVAALPFKRTRAVPLGPWLSVSFLAVSVFYQPILRIPLIARATEAASFIFLGSPSAHRDPHSVRSIAVPPRRNAPPASSPSDVNQPNGAEPSR